MNVGQILEIFYLWSIFELVAFFSVHTLFRISINSFSGPPTNALSPWKVPSMSFDFYLNFTQPAVIQNQNFIKKTFIENIVIIGVNLGMFLVVLRDSYKNET